jgi:hypothetical protein
MVSISDIVYFGGLMTILISATSSRMGRPPMNVKPTVVRLGEGVPERIDAVLEPKEKRADLIREAIEREIARREKQRERE